METFDYIIVGGGTAGCILANRLTASGKHSVLLLEAGGDGRGFWISVPSGFSKLLVNPRFNWRFSTAPEANTLNRVIAVPRGKGLGGSTLINGMIYVRGTPADYDHWAARGASGWAFTEVEPYFRKLENTQKGGAGRGTDGPMHISEVAVRHPLSEALLAAAVQDGQALNPDYNCGDQDGFGYYQVAQYRGRRWSAADGYLKPAKSRRNLTIRTDAHVLRLQFSDDGARRCTGVVYQQRGRELSAEATAEVTVQARAEVILAAGAIQSPQVLELSGIGRPDVLQAAGVPIRHALPGVGEHYIDHFCTRMNWRVQGVDTLNQSTRGWRLAWAVAQYAARRTGILTLGTGLVFGFVKSRPDLPAADVQYFFMHASYANAAERKLDRAPGMTLGVAQLRPESVGSIHIQSPDPLSQPRICPNFLASTVDQDSLIGGMQAARRIIAQPAMRGFVAAEISPGLAVQTREQWLQFARENGQTIYHPIGTCRMGGGSDDVVSPELKVHGIDGLRVIDASVMPAMVSGNIQAAVMMVAEKGADLVLRDAK